MEEKYYEEEGKCWKCGQPLHPDGYCMECDFCDEGGN